METKNTFVLIPSCLYDEVCSLCKVSIKTYATRVVGQDHICLTCICDLKRTVYAMDSNDLMLVNVKHDSYKLLESIICLYGYFSRAYLMDVFKLKSKASTTLINTYTNSYAGNIKYNHHISLWEPTDKFCPQVLKSKPEEFLTALLFTKVLELYTSSFGHLDGRRSSCKYTKLIFKKAKTD